MQLSPNCQAILLLTTSFGRAVEQFEQPLSPAEWATLSQWLQAHNIEPEQLLREDLTALLDGWSDQKVSLPRMERLLRRGIGLGIAAERWERAGLWILTQSHRSYPMRLKTKLGNFAPPVLFGCGNKDLINRGGVAIFGPRSVRGEDISYTKKLAMAVSNYGKSLISSGTLGIDIAAVETALKANGTCISLLAGSLIKTLTSRRYRYHLLEDSLVFVTPFNPEVAVFGNNALLGNRYIYCLSDCAIIVDSDKNKHETWKGAVENIKNNWVPIFAKENNYQDSGNKALLGMGASRATLNISKIYSEVNRFRSEKSTLKQKREKNFILHAEATSRNREPDNRAKSKNISQAWSTGTRIFIDTSSLMDDAAEFTAWQFIIPTCRYYGIPPPIVTKSVWDELNGLQKSRATSKKNSTRAQAALRLVEDLHSSGLVSLVREKGDKNINSKFHFSKFNQLRHRYQLVLFTQDMMLAKSILLINIKSKSDFSHIEVFRVHAEGPMRWEMCGIRESGVKLVRFGYHDRFQAIGHFSAYTSKNAYLFEYPKKSIPISDFVQPFEKREQVTSMDETLLNASIPGKGDFVKNLDGGLLRLTRKIGSGGEGTVFETNDPELVCKIYDRNHLKVSTIAKIKLMTSRKINNEKICWPSSVVQNVDGEYVGFLMPGAAGRVLRGSFFGGPKLGESFSHWTRFHIIKLAVEILDAIEYLHKLNVLLGDINPTNILVEDESTVYFVDCDSYQVEGFPCPVGMAPFLAPELLYGTDLCSTLRTYENEEFAVATLMFMLLHTGKPPYTCKGGQDLAGNVKAGYFPYSVDLQDSKNVPDGPWVYMWGQLPRYMRVAFSDFFGCKKSKSVRGWRNLLERYMSDLNKGHVSDELYPSTAESLDMDILKESEVFPPRFSF